MFTNIDSKELLEALPPLRRFALTMTRNEEDAMDLVHDSIERALRKQHLFDPGTNLRAWIFTICRRQFLNQIRKRNAGDVPVKLENTAQDALSTPANQEQALQLRDVADAFQKLPLQDKVILSMVTIEGLSYQEAGRLLKIPLGTVRSRLSRARARLKNHIGWETAMDAAA